MKVTKKQLVRIIKEGICSAVYGLKENPNRVGLEDVVILRDVLELGTLTVIGKAVPFRAATRYQPSEGGNFEAAKFEVEGEEMSLDDVVERENKIRKDLGLKLISADWLLQIIDERATEEGVGHSFEDD